MALTLQLCEASDMPHLTPVYMTAFKDDLSQRCFPRNSSGFAWWTNMNVSEFQEPGTRFLKVVDGEGKIVGYGKWNVPVRVDGKFTVGGGADANEMPVWPAGGDEELSNEFFRALGRSRQELMGNRPHYYLEILATLPEYQGRGVAKQIIQWGLDRADADELGAYIEAGPGLTPLYEKYGWKVRSSFTPSRLVHEECMMVREAKADGGSVD